MNNNSEKLDHYKINLRTALKQKLLQEKDLIRLRSLERSLCEDLRSTEDEIVFFQSNLDELKNQMSEARHQISMVQICTASEKTKIDAHITNLYDHKKGFDQLFDKERQMAEQQHREHQEKQAEVNEARRQKQLQAAKDNERQLQEALLVESECVALERECAVLKKRNTAIMLQLRRKLVEAQQKRRQLMEGDGADQSKFCHD